MTTLTPQTKSLCANAVVCVERGKPSVKMFRLYYLWHWVVAVYELTAYTQHLEQRLAEYEERQPAYAMPVRQTARG